LDKPGFSGGEGVGGAPELRVFYRSLLSRLYLLYKLIIYLQVLLSFNAKCRVKMSGSREQIFKANGFLAKLLKYEHKNIVTLDSSGLSINREPWTA